MTAPDYTGHVDAKGDPSTRDLPDITVTKLSVGPMDNNAYLLVCKHTGEGVLIDAANDADRILTLLTATSAPTPLRTVITTHQHWDHHVALPAVVTATGARTAAGVPDAPALPVTVDQPLDHGDTVALGDCTLEIIALRGTPPARWPCCTGIRRVTATCSRVTRSFRAGPERRTARRTSPR